MTMMLDLTDLSSESLQSQIVRQVRARILAGEMPDGTDLPSIRGLARTHHVSVITVQRAYETLMRDGLIHSRRGKGFFVSPLPERRRNEMATERLVDNLTPLVREALAEGLDAGEIRNVIELILKEEV